MKTLLNTLIILLLSSSLWAQDTTLFSIDNHPFSKGEFERIYLKNNSMTSLEKNKSLEDYLELYINFKLKVLEAEKQGLDTLSKFKREYLGYKKQLERPYFSDKEVTKALIKEASERQYYDVRASHILIGLKAGATPKDTLKAYKKAQNIKRQLEKGADFEKLAQTHSTDPSVKKNKGDLGYFTVFQMVYPFENAAYNTPIGKISDLVRTRYGYHILKVTDKRKALGKVKVAHIMVGLNKNPTSVQKKAAEQKIQMIYKKLKKKEDFKELAKLYSDDKNTAPKGGELNWFGTGKMVPSFEKQAFSLENKGDFTKPFRTAFGWHILTLLDKKDFVGLKENSADLATAVRRDMRSSKSEASAYAKIKKDYNYVPYTKNLNNLKKRIDDSLFKGGWNGSSLKHLERTLFELDNHRYTQQGFVDFLTERVKTPNAGDNVDNFVQFMYDDYLKRQLKKVKVKHLPEENAEYKYLLQEYYDGILLFDVTNKEVWDKAVKDSIGLTVFYDEHKQDYMWGIRVKAEVFETKNKKIQSKLQKFLKKRYKKSYDLNKVLSVLNKKDSTAVSLIKEDVFSEGDYAILDEANKTYSFFAKKGLKMPLIITEKSRVVYISEQFNPEPKPLDLIKGKITADYQDAIEKEWIKSLRKKSQVKINKEALNSLIEKYQKK